jgi:hypothetical protein
MFYIRVPIRVSRIKKGKKRNRYLKGKYADFRIHNKIGRYTKYPYNIN